MQPTLPRRYDEYGVFSIAWSLFTGEHPYTLLWQQFEALSAHDKERVDKALRNAVLDAGSVHNRLAMAVYIEAIPGINHVRPSLSQPVWTLSWWWF